MIKSSPKTNRGFSLIECVIALVVLLVVSLAVISVFNYSFTSGESSRKRFGGILLAEQRIENLRNTDFNQLTAGTTTEENVMYDGVSYRIVRIISDTDLLTVATAPGPEVKQIIITVSPTFATLTSEAVTIITVRAKNMPGPNRKSNAP
jgi:prepilin-type N-terminal cleavage/methylation domain-containing protein